MRIAVDYQSEQLEFEVPADRLVAAWNGPESVAAERVRSLVRDALEKLRGYPPLRQAVVPGDRVVVALDPATPELPTILSATCEVLNDAGVANETIHGLLTAPPPDRWRTDLSWTVHDPDDTADFAYLASTDSGRRIYLNRLATDADFVLAIGPFGFDATLGVKGPWSVIFPGLSNAETQLSLRSQGRELAGVAPEGRETLSESAGVSWLLGSQFQIGVLPGARGLAGIVAGIEEAVQEEGLRALASSWTFRPERRADLAVVGVGRPDRPAGFGELADALATATRLVRPGGKIAVLSRVGGTPGPAVGRLLGVEEARSRIAALKGQEDQPDYLTARKLARALIQADVYLFSDLEEDLVEDLSMIALGKASEARRLVDVAASCLLVSHAEMTKAEVENDD